MHRCLSLLVLWGLMAGFCAAEESAPAEPTAPAPETTVSAEKPLSFDESYHKVTPGMTEEEVSALVGDDLDVIATGQGGEGRIIKWEGPDKTSFAARFIDGRLDRITKLHKPPEIVPKDRLVAELGQKEPQKPPEAPKAPAIAPPEPEKRTETPEEAEPAPPSGPQIVKMNHPTADRAVAAYKNAKLPKFSVRLEKGPHDVIFENNSPNPVKVGIRTGKAGKDISIGAGLRQVVFLKRGTYNIFYVDAGDPTALCNAGPLTIGAPPETIVFPLGD